MKSIPINSFFLIVKSKKGSLLEIDEIYQIEAWKQKYLLKCFQNKKNILNQFDESKYIFEKTFS